ncbi:polysaccharide pyruvyl transferase family protein [uncultured Formosa sp.]|uniref:polysaccharide pyruvyl transferase family protein n=1 Tax=uncultured Formosa sp. TaxID=255435 RepID=UPI002637F318|nr:polysaccharide pyruvyl transferase family protein [uncultured Formosa sp.]
MNILIDNAGFVNKGAELMLFAAKNKLEEISPSSKLVLREYVALMPLPEVREKGFYILKDIKGGKYNLIPNKLTHFLGVIRPSDIDLVIDAGGFQFSDQWEKSYSKENNIILDKYYSNLKSKGAKIVFLPQAFGPFTQPLALERIKIVFKNADLIYAREQASYQFLVDVFGESSKIKMSPDFTNIYKPKVPMVNLLANKEYVGVIPNQKMITHTDTSQSNQYFDFILKLCKAVIQRGEKLILINHEGTGDYEIIKKLQDQLPEDVVVLSDLNSSEVKAVISRLKLLVSSRFHGVVSGLSQGVPTFCTGWSHKYQELLRDYKVEDNYLLLDDYLNAVQKIESVLDTPNNNSHIQTEETINQLKEQVEHMWMDIKKLYF